MLRFNRDILIRITYVLIGVLLVASATVVIHFENPERLIKGVWVEKEWVVEKGDRNHHELFNLGVNSTIRREVLHGLDEFSFGTWIFKDDGTVQSANNDLKNVEWFIRGRGHVLELKRDGKAIESFQISKISDDLLELHINLDMQIKGILKIVLERKVEGEQYAKKI